MNELIKGLKSFSLNKNETDFDNLLDQSIISFSGLVVEENEQVHWDLLKSNYSKLRYINYVNNSLHLENHEKFMKSLQLFMDYIDTVTMKYFDEINFNEPDESPEINEQSRNIKLTLEKSLCCENLIQKMKFVLDAYSELVPIVENIRCEKYNEVIDDEEFLENFSFKRQKKN